MSSIQLTVGDTTRTYTEAKGVNVAEVAKGNATACKALPAASVTYPGAIQSVLMQKTKGGSGTVAGQIRVHDERRQTDLPVEVTNVTIDVMQRPGDSADVEYAGALITQLATRLTENNCQLLKELYAGMHSE